VRDLGWSWQCLPYLVCVAALSAVVLLAALIRGDRVLRLGMIGAAAAALPWAICSSLVACMHDAEVATRVLRLGNGPVALIGPDLFVVLLGASGQLERYRWLARAAAVVGGTFLALCWLGPWTVPGVQVLSSGMFYPKAGPITWLHVSQLGIWLLVGLVMTRTTAPRGDRRRVIYTLISVLGLGTVASTDLLLVYGVAGVYPIAWLPALLACGLAIYLMVRTDFLRSRGFDHGALIELGGAALATAVIAYITAVAPGGSALGLALLGALVWVIATASAWGVVRRRPVRVVGERRLAEFVASVPELATADEITARLGVLWKGAIGIELIGLSTRVIGPELAAWLVAHGEPLAMADLVTMRLAALRPQIEALGADGVTLVVPLVDRDTLVGLVEAKYDHALRDDERGFVAESARAAARQLTFVSLAREASLEVDTAREVEVAEAMRLQTAASRDDELGRWSVVAAYRSAARTTGAGWSASLLDDGRLAVMVTEAQAHGIPAALATAALTGAFAAAVIGNGITLNDLLASLRASADGVVRGGEPVAAFVAILDGATGTIEYGCAGHHGGHLMAQMPQSGSMSTPRPVPVALGGGGGALGASLAIATRGTLVLPPDAMLIVASSALRGDGDDARWVTTLRDLAPLGPRLAQLAVERASAAGEPAEDLLAVIVRARPRT
jgi:GAF domain-containing protein